MNKLSRVALAASVLATFSLTTVTAAPASAAVPASATAPATVTTHVALTPIGICRLWPRLCGRVIPAQAITDQVIERGR